MLQFSSATAVSLNIVDHLECVTNQPNVSTAQVITLQTQSKGHNGRKRRKFSKSNVKKNLSFPEARKQYKQFYTGQTYASAVKPGTCNKSKQTENKSTQTDESFTEYIKQQATEKTQGTQEKRYSSHPGKSNSSNHGSALKQATLDMTKKDEEKKKKEKKDKLKNQQKEERWQQYQKEQAQKETEAAQKASWKESFFCVCWKRWRGGHGRWVCGFHRAIFQWSPA